MIGEVAFWFIVMLVGFAILMFKSAIDGAKYK